MTVEEEATSPAAFEKLLYSRMSKCFVRRLSRTRQSTSSQVLLSNMCRDSLRGVNCALFLWEVKIRSLVRRSHMLKKDSLAHVEKIPSHVCHLCVCQNSRKLKGAIYCDY